MRRTPYAARTPRANEPIEAAINITRLTRSAISADFPHSSLDVKRLRILLRSDLQFPVFTGTTSQIIAEVDPNIRSFILTNGIPPRAVEHARSYHPDLEQKSPPDCADANVTKIAVEPRTAVTWQ
jgi:hypothetical protein